MNSMIFVARGMSEINRWWTERARWVYNPPFPPTQTDTANIAQMLSLLYFHYFWKKLPLMTVCPVPLLSLCQSVWSPLTHSTTYSETDLLLDLHFSHSCPSCVHAFSSSTSDGSVTKAQKYHQPHIGDKIHCCESWFLILPPLYHYI